MNPGTLMGRGRTAEVYDRGEQVLKLFFDWVPAHSVEYEARITNLIYQQGIGVPKVFDTVELNGRRGIIFEKIEGITMLKAIQVQPWRFMELAWKMAELQAKLHTIQIPGLFSLTDSLEHDIREVEVLPEERKKELIRRLRQWPEGEGVCHYDFHPDNIMLSPGGMVIIDWPGSRQGDPLADVARTSLLLTLGEPAPGTPGRFIINTMRPLFFRTYLKQYRKLYPASEEQISKWKILVAAARLHEKIPEEREALLRIVMEESGVDLRA